MEFRTPKGGRALESDGDTTPDAVDALLYRLLVEQAAQALPADFQRLLAEPPTQVSTRDAWVQACDLFRSRTDRFRQWYEEATGNAAPPATSVVTKSI